MTSRRKERQDADSYAAFLAQKAKYGEDSGFSPILMPDFLYPFQASLVEWAIRKGRAAIFADCGLGKTPMQLVWSENVVRHTNKPVLILTPLAVASQTVREAHKFAIEAHVARDGKVKPNITVTNYQQLEKFSPHDFAGVVCDESGILKDSDSKTRNEVIDFMRTIPHRLLCTATAAPNDYVELGNSSEALGELGYQDMITKFFKQQQKQGFQAWGRLKYRLRSHAERDFWRWVCSWSRAIRKPSDLGFDDTEFILPPLETVEHVVEAKRKRDGYLFDVPARTLEEQREERRRTLEERCEKVADLVADSGKPCVCWAELNDEADLIEHLIPDSKQVSGADSDERKEELFDEFANGNLRVLVTKTVIGAWGLNWQHCQHQTHFVGDSFERYYQAVRRCWRFGQKHKVRVDIIASEGQDGVSKNLQRKADQTDLMFARQVENMNQSLRIGHTQYGDKKAEVPAWL